MAQQVQPSWAAINSEPCFHAQHHKKTLLAGAHVVVSIVSTAR